MLYLKWKKNLQECVCRYYPSVCLFRTENSHAIEMNLMLHTTLSTAPSRYIMYFECAVRVFKREKKNENKREKRKYPKPHERTNWKKGTQQTGRMRKKSTSKKEIAKFDTIFSSSSSLSSMESHSLSRWKSAMWIHTNMVYTYIIDITQ